MPAISDLPQRKVPSQAYQRAQNVIVVLRSQRHGGTASDVRSAMIDATRQPISLEAIKSALWHLFALGLIQFEELNNSRWWKIKI